MEVDLTLNKMWKYLHLTADELREYALSDFSQRASSMADQHITACFSCREKVCAAIIRTLCLSVCKIGVKWGETPKLWINNEVYQLEPQNPTSAVALVSGLSRSVLLAYRKADAMEPGKVLLGVEIDELSLVIPLSLFSEIPAEGASAGTSTICSLSCDPIPNDSGMITEVLRYNRVPYVVKFALDQRQAVFLEVSKTSVDN